LTQNFFLVRNRWYEAVLLGIVTFTLLRPDLISRVVSIVSLSKFMVGALSLVLFGIIFILQKKRYRKIIL
jgi:Domain of unknown function (DUF3394)